MNNKEKFFPTDPKKIRDTIRLYERAFRVLHYDDGPGKRFLLGPLYLLMGDTPGALRSYEWYEKTFPDDIPESFNHLCWVLTLLRSEKMDLAKLKLRELIFENLYMVPVFLGENPKQHPFKHASNWSELSHIVEGPTDEIFSLWNDSEQSWIREQWENPKLSNDIRSYIALYKILDATMGHEERGKILNELRILASGLQLL
jgi:hypothetical protein